MAITRDVTTDSGSGSVWSGRGAAVRYPSVLKYPLAAAAAGRTVAGGPRTCDAGPADLVLRPPPAARRPDLCAPPAVSEPAAHQVETTWTPLSRVTRADHRPVERTDSSVQIVKNLYMVFSMNPMNSVTCGGGIGLALPKTLSA